MSWSPDPELRQMFRDELDQRSRRLVVGARALRDGPLESDVSGAMMREGHTIKGTARVLGYGAVSVGGQLVEEIWRRIQHDELEPTPELAIALEDMAESVQGAADADPETGSVEHYEALARLSRLVPDIDLPDVAPPDPTASGDPDRRGTPTEPASLPETTAVAFDTAPEADPVDTEEVATDRETVEAPAAQPEHASVVREWDATSETAPQEGVEAGSVQAPAAADRRRPGRSMDIDHIVAAVERWADGATSLVNAGGLIRLINLLSEARAQVDVLYDIVDELGDGAPQEWRGRLVRSTEWLKAASEDVLDDSLRLAAVPLTGMTNTLPQLVRFLAKKLNKEVQFEIKGDADIFVDREVLDRLGEPVRQVLVNALYHGLETPRGRKEARKAATGTIAMSVEMRDGTLEIEITDDGAGVDWEEVRTVAIDMGLLDESQATIAPLEHLVFQEGMSTGAVGESKGEGQGLFVVAETVESLFGRVRFSSEPGAGTTVTISVPASRALEKLQMIESSGVHFGIPAAAVDAVAPIDEIAIDERGETRELDWNESRIPVLSLAEVAGAGHSSIEDTVIVLSHRSGTAAFTIERASETYELAVKQIDEAVAAPKFVRGAAYLGDGGVALVLDAGHLIERARNLPDELHAEARVLVVDDSQGARAVISGALASAGFSTSVAGSVAEALEVLDEHDVDALVVDFSMPNADGVALVKEVRRRRSRIPIVMLSGVATEEDQTRAKRAGVDAFYDKGSFREGIIADTLWEMLEA